MTIPRRLVWLLASACLALLLYFAFRGYLAPTLLLEFANSLLCRAPSTVVAILA